MGLIVFQSGNLCKRLKIAKNGISKIPRFSCFKNWIIKPLVKETHVAAEQVVLTISWIWRTSKKLIKTRVPPPFTRGRQVGWLTAFTTVTSNIVGLAGGEGRGAVLSVDQFDCDRTIVVWFSAFVHLTLYVSGMSCVECVRSEFL